MQTATLVIASLSLACSALSLGLLLRGAHEFHQVRTEMNTAKDKLGKNAVAFKAALTQMEL